MDWKEFLRPTKWKIILTILFIVLGLYGGAQATKTCPLQAPGDEPCSRPGTSLLHIFGISSGIKAAQVVTEPFESPGGRITLPITIIGFILLIAVVLVYNYLLAAIIVFLANIITKKT